LVAGESTVYPVLKRLEADALLASRWVESSSGPPRKYYKLSPAGGTFLKSAPREWDAVVEIMIRLQGEGGGEEKAE
jgi:PadR family transcriptional regulator, regulatory protein PadR